MEDTGRQVDFIIRKLGLRGGERVLDLACGFGRHSLELARRGFAVTGVDITPSYIRFAEEVAQKEGLNARFFCQDIREANFEQTFDAVLNMADGAIGYLEKRCGKPNNIFRCLQGAQTGWEVFYGRDERQLCR